MGNKLVTRIAIAQDIVQWDNFVKENSNSLFHRWFWLKAIEEETGYELIPIITYKGEKIISIFPIFKKSFVGLKMILSPPPKCAIPNLGPIIKHYSTRQSGNEIQNHRVVESQISFIRTEIKYDYLNITSQINTYDTRPFIWNKFTPKPLYTYVIDLTRDTETLFNNLDGRIRTAIRKVLKEKDFEIVENEEEVFWDIIRIVRQRYKEQNLEYPLSDDYMRKLYDQYGGSKIKVKGIKRNNETITGLILLEENDYVGHWVGGINNKNTNMNGLNELLHWETIIEYSKKNFQYYELIGGNTKHLAVHKTRYNGDLAIYFELQDIKFIAKVGNYLYKTFLLKK